MERAGIVVAGAGIVGSAVAYALAAAGERDVLVLEAEDVLNRHSSGRNASMYIPLYESGPFGALAEASMPFLRALPDGFSEHPVLKPLGSILVAKDDDKATLQAEAAEARRLGIPVEELDGKSVQALVPIVRPDRFSFAMHYPTSVEIDVAALSHGYIAGAKRAGVRFALDRRLTGLIKTGDRVMGVRTSRGDIACEHVVNAGGAWAGEIGRMAGASPFRFDPLRRHIIVVKLDAAGTGHARWPFFRFPSAPLYIKNDGARLLASPMDEEPDQPGDCMTNDETLAWTADLVNEYTTLAVRRIEHSWAGHRTFSADRVPVLGPDPIVRGFHWAAGLGGAGVMTSPAMGRLVAARLLGLDHDRDLAKAFDPARFARAEAGA